MKRILFCYSYDYLSIPHYNELIKYFPGKCEFAWLFLPSDSALPVGIEHMGIDIRVKLLERSSGPFFTRKTINLVKKFINYLRLQRMLKNHNPNLVVFSSDILPEEMKLLYALCKVKGIPAIIIWPAEFDYVPLWKWGGKPRLSKSSYGFLEMFFYACRYRMGTIGTFRLGSPLYVSTEEIIMKLQDVAGIDIQGVKAIGIPYSPAASSDNVNYLVKEFSRYRKRIVLLTEAFLKEEQYLIALYQKINHVFTKSGQQGCLLVRFHPRESKEIRALTRNLLKAENIYFLNDHYTLEEICSISDLSIAHYSKALILAALSGTRIMSINLGQEENTFLKTEEMALKVSSLQELEDRLAAFLDKGYFGPEGEEALKRLTSRYKFKPEVILEDLKKIIFKEEVQ